MDTQELLINKVVLDEQWQKVCKMKPTGADYVLWDECFNFLTKGFDEMMKAGDLNGLCVKMDEFSRGLSKILNAVQPTSSEDALRQYIKDALKSVEGADPRVHRNIYGLNEVCYGTLRRMDSGEVINMEEQKNIFFKIQSLMRGVARDWGADGIIAEMFI